MVRASWEKQNIHQSLKRFSIPGELIKTSEYSTEMPNTLETPGEFLSPGPNANGVLVFFLNKTLKTLSRQTMQKGISVV